ncbi:nucleotidyltransferase family protein [Acidaminobacter sp. JC074]|uniref:nucleotidyltransferase family protein n=1 Tax=Acidaminobacter sp. JC074 TaxID=2530199 RepID=UPI001F100846|nr:nucleotidyltransferase family protein [Acidaminobacter sp. JC074]MCH4886130.1 nucleotidyltransferase family protein [Acidaminobacter sp. JC074]
MICGLVLASGFSRRMQANKLIQEVEGLSLIEYVVKAACLLDPVYVITQYQAVEDLISGYPCKVIYNDHPERGMSESIKLGIKAAKDCSGYMIFLGDQPTLSRKVVEEIKKEAERYPDKIVIPYYRNIKGHPIYIPCAFKEDLIHLEGDIGARDIIKKNSHLVIRLDLDDETSDIDTIENLEEFRHNKTPCLHK